MTKDEKAYKIERDYVIYYTINGVRNAYYLIDAVRSKHPDIDPGGIPELCEIRALIDKIRNKGYVNVAYIDTIQNRLTIETGHQYSLGTGSNISFEVTSWHKFLEKWSENWVVEETDKGYIRRERKFIPGQFHKE